MGIDDTQVKAFYIQVTGGIIDEGNKRAIRSRKTTSAGGF